MPLENIKILLEKFESEEKDMVIEVIQKENERQRRIGRKQGIKQGIKEGIKEGIKTTTHNFIIQMIKNKMSDKTIKKITNIEDEELKKIKKEMEIG